MSAGCVCAQWCWWVGIEGRGDTFPTPEGKSLNKFVSLENVTEASQHTLRQAWLSPHCLQISSQLEEQDDLMDADPMLLTTY